MIDDGGRDRRAVLNELLESVTHDARANVLIAGYAETLGQSDISERAYRAAVSLIGADAHRASRAMVAKLASQRDDFETVTRLLDGYVETSFMNDMLGTLVTAFANETPVRERAQAFFQELPRNILEQAPCATAYGYLQSKRGDLTEAAKWLSHAISVDPANLTAWLGIFNVFLRQGRSGMETLEQRAKEIDLAKVRGSPSQKVGLSHYLRDIGQYETAARYAYETVRANPNDPEAALLYFGLYITPQAERMLPKAEAVGNDTWVALERGGDTLEILIEDGPNDPSENRYNVTHPFVVPALGLKVGEYFEQAKAFGLADRWTVKEIKHKYQHMLHQMEHFNVRFPDAEGLYSFSTVDGDIEPFLNQARQLSERNQRVANLYIERHFPLAVVAGMVGEEPTGLAGYIGTLGHNITACLGDERERAAAARLVLRPPAGGAVLDFYTAWIASTFRILAPLKSMFGRLIVPRSVVDSFLELERTATHMLGGESISLGYHNGQFTRHVTTEEEANRRRQLTEQRRMDIEANCDVLPIQVPNDASEVAKALVAKCGSHTLDPAFLAATDNRVLLSDDLYYRQCAHQACGARVGVWLQIVLMVAKRRGRISRAEYAEAIIGLAVCRHAHLTLDANTLCDVLEADETEGLYKFLAVANFIGTESADIASHFRVAKEFLNAVWSVRIGVSRVKKEAASGIILERLLRRREGADLVLALRSEVAGIRQAASYLMRWLRGHFLIS